MDRRKARKSPTTTENTNVYDVTLKVTPLLLFYFNPWLSPLPQTSSPPSSSPPPKLSEEMGSTPEVVTQQLNGSAAASAIGQSLELTSLAQPIPCALASRDNQSEGAEVEAPCCLDDCPSDGALQKEE